jgi:pimeloyl-ACP methyl ester carboxylesterase
MLLHGLMDAAATWDLVAPLLAERGLRVLAPDLRGFGEGPRVPSGGYYHFPDYVFDVADLVDALVPPDSPLVLVGHSMGGTVATMYAGTFPERPAALAVLEGAGPPDQSPDEGPARMRAWIEGVRAVRTGWQRTMMSHDDALGRLAGNHSRVPLDILSTRIEGLARALGGGRFVWRADVLHTTRAPVPFLAPNLRAFARRVACPVLFVSGGPLGWHPADEEDRLGWFAKLARVELADAGHMMHWTRPEELARAIEDFVAAGRISPPGVGSH